MIADTSLSLIGRTLKPHGINGEINAVVDADIDLDTLSCLIMRIDGINVPFFIQSWRSRGSESVLIKFDHIADQTQAEPYCGLELMALSAELPEADDTDESDGFYASDLIGWAVADEGKPVGTVEDYDDSTENLLLTVRAADGQSIYVPLADELIIDIDPTTKILNMNLPTGLHDL